MNKKYIVVPIIVFFNVLAVGLYISLKKERAADIQTSSPATTTNSPAATPSYYPAWGIRRQVNNPLEEIKNIFISQLSAPPLSANSNIQGIYFYGTNKKIIPLDTLQSALKFSIHPDLFNMIDNNDYDLFYCYEKTSSDIGIIFYLRAPSTGSLSEPAYQEASNNMKKWEPAMFRDLHPLLFPNDNFSEEYLEKPLEFKNGQAHYAEVIAENNIKKSLNYRFGGSPLIISSSLECLESAEEYFFDVQE